MNRISGFSLLIWSLGDIPSHFSRVTSHGFPFLFQLFQNICVIRLPVRSETQTGVICGSNLSNP